MNASLSVKNITMESNLMYKILPISDISMINQKVGTSTALAAQDNEMAAFQKRVTTQIAHIRLQPTLNLILQGLKTQKCLALAQIEKKTNTSKNWSISKCM